MPHIARLQSSRQRDLAQRFLARHEPDEPGLQHPLKDHHPAWGAYDADGHLVAVAACTVYDGNVHLTTCVVAPAARGHNLQRRLIRVRVAYARRITPKRPNAQVITYTHRNNRPSQINLLKEGFVPFSVTGLVYVSYAKWL